MYSSRPVAHPTTNRGPVPDIHHRRSYSLSHHEGGGAIRNRHSRSSRGNDSRRDGSGSRRWSGPYNVPRKEERVVPKGDKGDVTSNDTSNNGSQTSYRQPKPLIISPTSNKSEPTETHNNPSTLPRLNPSSPKSARRIHQRRRQILFGKNTSGYEQYCKQVPKEKRKKCSMDHPMTPDHMVDVSVKRWQGLVNAWRRALHKFDPPDLAVASGGDGTIKLAPRPFMTQQEEEIEQAKANGLQVAFGNMMSGEMGGFGVRVGESEVDGEGVHSGGGKVEMEEEDAYQTSLFRQEEETEKDFLEEDCDDSDDDVL